MRNFDRQSTPIAPARGIGLAFVLVLLNLLMFLSVAAVYHFRQAKGVAASEISQRNLHLMTQAAYGLSTESSDVDGDGIIESPAMLIASPSPSDGGEIPTTSGAPRIDAWGTPYGYCAWDNGTTNSSTNHLTGDNPGGDSSIVFALVSAGPDRQFATTCANIKAGTVNGDDIAQTYTVAQLRQGLPRDAYQGVPVTNGTALSALNTSGMLKGQMRIQDDTSELMSWTGSGWSEVITNGGAGGINLYNRLKNYFINGDMAITQRGSSWSQGNVTDPVNVTLKTADHWRVTLTADALYGSASLTVNAYYTPNPSTNNTGNWPVALHYLHIYPYYTPTANTYASLEQPVEGVSRLAGQALTLSFYGNNEDGVADTVQIWVTQNFGTGGSPSAPITTKVGTITVPGSWAWEAATFTMPAIPGGTVFGSNGDDYTLVSLRDYNDGTLDYSMLQLEAGSKETPFEHLDPELELFLCQRYHTKGDPNANSTENYVTYYWPVTGTLARRIKFKNPMRAVPTITIDGQTGGSVTVGNITTSGFTAYQTIGTTGEFASAIGWSADADW